MSISEPFIRRPVMTTLVMVAIFIFGMLAYQRLPVNDLPTVDYPTINVSANLPGASPETMAAAVATPLEQQFSTIPGVDVMTSSSTLGNTSITLQFTLSRSIDGAAADVQSAISRVLGRLPQGILPPAYRKVDPSAQSIILYTLTSSTLGLAQLDEYAETLMAQRLSMVDGVAQVTVGGSQKYAVRIQLDPMALQSQKVGIDEVAAAVNDGNVSMPTGVLWGTDKAYTLVANGQLAQADQFAKLTVAYRNGAPVRLAALGNVVNGVQDTKQAGWFNRDRGITLFVQRQPGTNTVEVAERVKATMAQLQTQLPAAVQLNLLYDRSASIEDSVGDVKFTLGLTLVLVVLVIFLFLRNVPATIIPSLALPLSLVGTFAAMYALGYSLDNLSLMALTLAVGFVVDDAIVVLENIVRHMEMGKTAWEASLEGSREIGFTVVSMTISLVAVFIPILFLPGLIGRLFNEFAATIGIAILVSGFVSLTLTPMLCSRFLSHESEERSKHSRFYQATERIWLRILGSYDRSLQFVMRHRRATLAFSVMILIGTAVLAVIVPKGFIPSEDTNQLNGTTEAAQGASFEAMLRYQQAVNAILAADSNVAGFSSSIGVGGRSGVINQGSLFIRLKPREQRKLSADQVARSLTAKTSAIPGLRTYFVNPPVINIGGRGSKAIYQFTLSGSGSDTQILYDGASKLEGRMRDLPGLTDVNSDLQLKNPQLAVTIDRDRAAALGLTAAQIEGALAYAYGASQISTILAPNNQYYVVLELLPQYQRDLTALTLLSVRAPATGQLVPLSAVASTSPTLGPVQVNHSGQLPSVTISFNLAPGVSIGEAVQQVQQLARETLPSTIATGFAGQAQAFQAAQAGLAVLLIIAIFVIYIVLGILYESFIHPITILTGLPFAGFGALLALWIFRLDLSIYAFVGVILLVGLVKKNAIMMIDFAVEAERKDGKSAEEAILEACLVRFRPIMMTTAAALMGTLPIALGIGAGAESRRPLGVAVVGGLFFSQLITLFVTPVFYTYFDRLQRRFSPKAVEEHVVEGKAVVA